MNLFRTKHSSIPTADEALPGRDERCRARAARGARPPLLPPFPDGSSTCRWAWAASGARRGSFWQTPGVYTTAVGYAGGPTPNPTYREVCSGRPGTPRWCWSSSTRQAVGDRASCGSSGRATIPPRACGRATTPAPSTGRRSTGARRRSATLRSPRETPTRRRWPANGRGQITTEIAEARAVLLRRGLPPAVPGERTPTATAGSAAPASPARSAPASPPPDLRPAEQRGLTPLFRPAVTPDSRARAAALRPRAPRPR